VSPGSGQAASVPGPAHQSSLSADTGLWLQTRQEFICELLESVEYLYPEQPNAIRRAMMDIRKLSDEQVGAFLATSIISLRLAVSRGFVEEGRELVQELLGPLTL
jgi:hypothetical protein